jgi:cyclophilin family peptidyl-prolyl cis-trans isomerase
MMTGLFCLLLCACAGPQKREYMQPNRLYVELDTTKGDIVLELDPAAAPISVANFLTYATRGDYDGTIIHRVVPGFVIQGGGHTPDLTELPGDAPIKNEWQNGLKNVRGSVGMAREAEPDSATRQWYINLADNERLDTGREVSGGAGYAVFGHVVEGMEVVDKIAAVETYDQDGEGDDVLHGIPVKPVIVRRVRMLEP